MATQLDLTDVTQLTFAPYVGETFRLAVGGELTLCQAERSRYAPEGESRPFALLFEGEAGLNLPQQSYLLTHAALGDLEIFLVPVTPVAGRSRYEAVFN